MTNYYIVTQADVDAEGHIGSNTAVFTDEDGNTELYINAEEAREAIANEVANVGQGGVVLSMDGNEPTEYTLWSDIYTKILNGIDPEDGHFVKITFYDGAERTYTINRITV